MITGITVWVLMTLNAHNAISYSPPVMTLKDCQRMQQSAPATAYNISSQCVQITIPVTK